MLGNSMLLTIQVWNLHSEILQIFSLKVIGPSYGAPGKRRCGHLPQENCSFCANPGSVQIIRLLLSHNSMLDGVLNQLWVGRNIKLIHHFVLVKSYCSCGDTQNRGYLLHGVSFCE